MGKSSCAFATVATLLMLGPSSGWAQDAASQATYRDIEQTLGSVPTFFKMFPESGIAGAWAEFKGVQLNPETKLSGKVKELIGLAVAAQIPCTYCVYFHTAAAKLNGATEEEIRETVAMAAISRHWSTVLNGTQVDLASFKKETDAVLKLAGEKAKSASK
jgi:AhpD family alkylhydroperoxidase